MKKLSNLIIQHKVRTNIFENFCIDSGIEPSVDGERQFFDKKFLNFENRLPTLPAYRRYFSTLYERLSQSLDAEVLAKELEKQVGVDYFIDDINKNILWFSHSDKNLEKNPDFLSV